MTRLLRQVLSQQYERSGICRLKAKRKVEEDEGIDVESRESNDVDEYPDANDDGLSDEETGCAKKTSERFSF